jgi:hypothetical protein
MSISCQRTSAPQCHRPRHTRLAVPPAAPARDYAQQWQRTAGQHAGDDEGRAQTHLLVLVVHRQHTGDRLAHNFDLGKLVGRALGDLLHTQLQQTRRQQRSKRVGRGVATRHCDDGARTCDNSARSSSNCFSRSPLPFFLSSNALTFTVHGTRANRGVGTGAAQRAHTRLRLDTSHAAVTTPSRGLCATHDAQGRKTRVPLATLDTSVPNVSQRPAQPQQRTRHGQRDAPISVCGVCGGGAVGTFYLIL